MNRIDLPDPDTDGSVAVERAIAGRESRRSFDHRPIDREDIAAVLWAAQGLTHERDGIPMRAVPSAGATYPLVVFLEIARGSETISPGLYRYDPDSHTLEQTLEESIHDDLTHAALDQPVIGEAPGTLVVTADYDPTTSQYPDHGERYVHMEAGHAAQNVHLVCEARNLNSCPVGAFDDDGMAHVLDLPPDLSPLYLVPFGYRPE